jgi:uncharacterized membrane protein YccC
VRAFFAALFNALMAAWRDWRRDHERDTLVRADAETRNDMEDQTRDLEKAERITRAVDALRHDGAGRMPGPIGGVAPAGKPDTRGYRD